MIFKKTAYLLLFFTFSGIVAFGQQYQMPSQQQQDIDVSKKEMKRFVDASVELQTVQQDAQKRMMKAIQDNGMDVQRFSEIEQATRSGKEVDMSAKEEKAYEKTSATVQQEQMKIQQEALNIIKEHDFDRQRFMQISQALRSDKELVEQYKEIKSNS